MYRNLIILYLLLPIFSFSQQKEIDSLNKLLPTLRDSARIDCLNALSFQYQKKSNRDSAYYYNLIAFDEATRIQYIHGLAESTFGQAVILFYFDSDFSKSELLARKSINLFEKTNNKAGQEETYDILTEVVFSESKYEEAYLYTQRKYGISLLANDKSGMYESVSEIGVIHYQEGNYDSAFYYMHKAQQIAQSAKDKLSSSNILVLFGTLYRAIGNYPVALNLYRQVLENDDPENGMARIKDNNWETWVRMEYAELFSLQNLFDSAWHYYNLFDTLENKARNMRIYLVSTGETYFLQKQYSRALTNFLRGLQMHQRLNDQNEIKRTLLDIAKSYYNLNKNDSALKYARQGLDLAVQTRSNQFIRDGYEILYSVYDRVGQIDSAYYYYRRFNNIKDVVVNDQIKGRLAAFNYEQKIELLNKEKLISQQQLNFQQQKLKEQSLLRNILIGFIIVVLALGLLILRNVSLRNKNEKLEGERSRSDLQRKSVDLEMQALRAQMSPHFIFNCLNSINRFILKNESEAASDYMTKFSRLIRMVLVNSKNKLISLEEELAMLTLYIDMERLRFKNSFDYKVDFIDSIDPENIFIPPLLIQPFAENAIWHGLMNKDEFGHLEVSFGLEADHILVCQIVDNGIGRKAAHELKSKSAEKQKSLGLQITRERLDLMNENGERKTSFIVEDLVDNNGESTGTRVVLKIRTREFSDSIL